MLVSAIMPTWNRRKYVPRAVDCFHAQTWPEKELIVIDDGDDPISDLLAASNVLYKRLESKLTTGEKRNLACELASGEAIIHWDDDDWSAPGRIADQVPMLAKANVAGYRSMFFFDADKGAAYKFTSRNRYALGTSLCYRRSWWAAHRFEARRIGEDNQFVRQSRSSLEIKDAGQMMVAGIHAQQTSIKKTKHPEYKAVPISSLPAEFLALHSECPASM